MRIKCMTIIFEQFFTTEVKINLPKAKGMVKTRRQNKNTYMNTHSINQCFLFPEIRNTDCLTYSKLTLQSIFFYLHAMVAIHCVYFHKNYTLWSLPNTFILVTVVKVEIRIQKFADANSSTFANHITSSSFKQLLLCGAMTACGILSVSVNDLFILNMHQNFTCGGT